MKLPHSPTSPLSGRIHPFLSILSPSIAVKARAMTVMKVIKRQRKIKSTPSSPSFSNSPLSRKTGSLDRFSRAKSKLFNLKKPLGKIQLKFLKFYSYMLGLYWLISIL